MPSRVPRPRTRIPISSHNRRAESAVKQQAEHEKQVATRREKINTALSLLATALALPALAIGLLTYFDQKNSEEDANKKEAARVSYFWQIDAGEGWGAPSKDLAVENRGLNPATNVVIAANPKFGKHMVFDLGTISACTRVRIELGKYGAEVDKITSRLKYGMYFTSSTGQIWFNGGKAGMERRNKYPRLDTDFINFWKLEYRTEPLEACA
ncbi:hypothetical protein ACFXKC_00270 [Streptomyces sp. NPDC059340]|uniref:hypothetical protein n=1 Tax=Streptomyces sp. NPDC059340 TaxID=3346806 RepID=UPI0036A5B480